MKHKCPYTRDPNVGKQAGGSTSGSTRGPQEDLKRATENLEHLGSKYLVCESFSFLCKIQ